MKRLIIKEIENSEGVVDRIQVVEQTHRDNHFSNTEITDHNYFKHNNFVLYSSSYPSVMDVSMARVLGCVNGLYVRGGNRNLDNSIVKIPSQIWLEEMRRAVGEYNKHFANCYLCEERHCNDCNNSII